MVKAFIFYGVFVFLGILCRTFAMANESDVKLDKNRETAMTDRKYLLHYTREEETGLTKEVKNLSPLKEISTDKRKNRRMRKKKEKGNKASRLKNKSPKPIDYVDEQIQRNNEKLHLVRNRTIEILKNGLRILSAEESHSQTGKKVTSRVNETLLEKILSSAASRQDIISSTSGMYKVTVGGKTFGPKLLPQSEEGLSGKRPTHPNFTEAPALPQRGGTFQLPRTQSSSFKEIYKDYDYEEFEATLEFRLNDLNKSHETLSDYGSENFDRNVGIMLERIVEALKNISTSSNETCSNGDPDRDPCLKWLDCKESLSRAFIGENGYLPSCPCTYPSTIFYDDAIRDEKQNKYFRWRDASSEAERLDVYKPGAAYCIRSLVTRGSSRVSSQQCCYDRKLWLLTRGSGAGTINFVSPDVSKKLHFIADILPWRLCKGDFTRYNEARTPNNGNGCPENPEEQQYQLQVESSKNF